MQEVASPPLLGKKALILGIANEHSIAYGCARAMPLVRTGGEDRKVPPERHVNADWHDGSQSGDRPSYSRAVESGQIEQHPSIALTVRTVQHALNHTI
jgi:hypothetical protein